MTVAWGGRRRGACARPGRTHAHSPGERYLRAPDMDRCDYDRGKVGGGGERGAGD